MKKDIHYYYGHVVNYTPQEGGQLLIVVSVMNQAENGKEELSGYMIDTNDKKRFRAFCQSMLLYDKSGNINFDYLIGSKVIIKSVGARAGRQKVTFRIDTEDFQGDR